MKTLFVIAFAPLACALAFGLLVMGLCGVAILGQGVQRTSHGQSFFPPEPPPPKPTGLSLFMQEALTSPAGRNAARRHLLIPDPAFSRGASSLRSERVQRGIGHPLGREALANH
jgi:hypothetical protein